MSTSRIEFTTRKFEASHGKRPSGRGYWGFCPEQYANRENYIDYVKWFSGLYSDAKRAATEDFRSQYGGRVLVVVMP